MPIRARPVERWRSQEGVGMRRIALVVAGALSLAVTQLLGPAVAQDEPPLCGPPGEEVPATIVGSGTIVGLGGDDIICAQGGNYRVLGGEGDDVLIGDGLDVPPFIPSNGQNDDVLIGGPGDDLI